MADDKVKLLGQSAADIPRILGARINKLESLAETFEDEFTVDAFLQEDTSGRIDKVEEQIRGLIDDVETEFEELHTISDKLLKIADDGAENASEGARRVGLELENLTSEVAALDSLFSDEAMRVHDALQALSRIHDEMEGVATQRATIVAETFADIVTKYDEAKKATTEFNSGAKEQFTKLQQECEKQKFQLEEKVGKWGRDLVEVYASTMSDDLIEDLESANAKVVALLSGTNSFFQEEVVEPANQQAEGFLGKLDLFNRTIDDATTETKNAREWVDPTLQRIEEETNPLQILINQARELARTFSAGGF